MDQLGAAVTQHGFARQIRAALRNEGLTVDEYSRAHGLTAMRLRRLLRGDVVMRFEDVVNARRNLLGRRQNDAES